MRRRIGYDDDDVISSELQFIYFLECQMKLDTWFLGSTYAGSRDTLGLGWGNTQAVFIPGVGSIRSLVVVSNFIQFCDVLSKPHLLKSNYRNPNLISTVFQLWDFGDVVEGPADSSDQCKVHSCHGTAEEEVNRQIFEREK